MALPREGAHRIGLTTAALGAIAQLTAVVYEAATDNDGSPLLVGGLVLVVVGVVAMLAGGRVYRRDASTPNARLAQTVAPGAALLLIIAVAVAGSDATSRGRSTVVASETAPADREAPATTAHSHDATPTTPAAPTTAPGAAGAAGAAIANSLSDHGHGHNVPEKPLDGPTRAALAEQLVAARNVVARFPTVADATRAGYRMVTPYVPLIGAHYMNFALIDGRFDVNQPEMLLYNGTNPAAQMVGLSYYVMGAAEPDGFAGPNDHWHQHIGLCVRGTVVVGGEKLTAQECAARGGLKVDGANGWMVHAWVVPGWESSQGVFSAENPALT